jgi:mono/diheme cytochrome c family protein
MRTSKFVRFTIGLLAALPVMALVGCSESNPPEFTLNLEGRSIHELKTPEEQLAERKREQTITNLLTAAFGTPDEPYVFPESGLDLQKIKRAAGPSYSDQAGYQYGVYRKQCAHCHGISGDGNGPTAIFLNPYPRDYRQGVFKFTSTGPSMKPTRADLKRTIVEGLMGTAMPSFRLLPERDIEALVEYVKYLSMRGQTEIELNVMADQEEELPADHAALAAVVAGVAEQWSAAEDAVVVPAQENLPPFDPSLDKAAWQASVDRGRQLFRDGKTANCIKCHGPNGLGDGGGEDLYDDWNKQKPKEPNAHWSLPPQELKPRNLRLGIYRGGRRPIDIYRRIFSGIKGTPMPAAGNVLKEPQIWDVVNYVLQLPYEEKSEPAMGEGHLAEVRISKAIQVDGDVP